MKYGYFDDEAREYVISSPETPLPWINYLGTENFFGLISNTGGGYCFYKDALMRRILRYRYNNVPRDTGGRYFYIKDGRDIWSPGWKPVKKSLETYSCRHGLGYTVITGKLNGLIAKVTYFVPIKENCEIHKLELENCSEKIKSVKIFSFLEFCLWNAADDAENFQRNLNTAEVEVKGPVIYHKTEYRERRNHFAYYSVNRDVEGFDTDREAFLGRDRGFDDPAAVRDGKSRNSIAHGWSPIASHSVNVELGPNEKKTVVFVLGYCENTSDDKWESSGIINKIKSEAVTEKFRDVRTVDCEFAKLRNYWESLFSGFSVSTPDKHVNRMVNIWNQYQCMVTFNMSRSASYFESGMGRGMGFRDSSQDLLGFVHMVPDRARERILEIAATQFEDGSAYHQYQPLTKRGNDKIGSGFNDDPLWLVQAVYAYIAETGEASLLDEQVPFNNDDNKTASVFEHCSRSMLFTVKNTGPHGLPLIGRADWNDCLNLNTFSLDPDESFQTCGIKKGITAESVMIAGMFVYTGKMFAELCLMRGDKERAQDMQKQVEAMETAVIRSGWDGEWFLRAFDSKGNKIGSSDNREGKIYIESQGWCSMARIGKNRAYPEKALDSVKRYLDTEHGIVLLHPAYTEYDPLLGEITSYPPGYKENGGIFCHNNPWIMISEAMLGRGSRAFEYYRKICPSYREGISDIHGTEPFVYCQMIAGKEASGFGEAKNSWLTGTAAWNYTAVTQWILGIRPGFEGLMIDPCIPPEWEGFSAVRKFRGVEYSIVIHNPDHVSKGIRKVDVDGSEKDANGVIEGENKKTRVDVWMGTKN